MSNQPSARSKIVLGLIFIGLFLIEARLFYWQILKSKSLKTQAKQQQTEQTQAQGNRGRIFTDDGQLLVGNQPCYQLQIEKQGLEISQTQLAEDLAELIQKHGLNLKFESGEKTRQEQREQIQDEIIFALDNSSNWLTLNYLVDLEIEPELKWKGVYLTPKLTRYYPEASMAAHITGFVGKDRSGQETGYFGIEGALDKELTGRSEKYSFIKDALGLQLATQKINLKNLDGRDVYLTLRREIQFLAEEQLKKGLKQYAAQQGEIIIMDPRTGAILALAAWPNYQQNLYDLYQTADFKNPCLSDLFEPGSTFKTLTVAAGIDAGVITPTTSCTDCNGPRVIGGYTIRTWNDVYNPGITIEDALAKSDNTAMIFVSQRLGADRMKDYLEKFGIGQKLDLDLQEDTNTPFPQKLGPVELATTSFGQGVSVNSLQLVRAVSAIANQGKMMKPAIIKSVYDPQKDERLDYEPEVVRQVISAQTANQVTQMMVKAARQGEAQWIGKNYLVAGKTGTSQIPSPDGGYKKDATIASFIGFAPPDDPKFIMLVKLVEPQTSPWAAETAAPLWFKTAQKLFLLLNITNQD
ncbi:MAG: hypothetical protein GF381_03325 [Candidatus Pacebacteria bacterium]|nr:hypothetical protein [Candidatus Paceibacterota bacterium]